jgi:ABC-type multidrug transport system ATPase subunit
LIKCLKISNITKAFSNKEVLKNISLDCTISEVIGIYGRNGSGKSTLMEIIFGTMKANRKEIYLDEKPISGTCTQIGFHHQQVFLPKNMTVRNLVPLYFTNGEKQSKVFYNPVINRIEKQKVGSLSLGEQRYLQFLLLINSDHDFLLLDEPFSMLEPYLIESIKQLITDSKHQKGFIIADHYYHDVLSISDKNYILRAGMLEQIKGEQDLVEMGYLKR